MVPVAFASNSVGIVENCVRSLLLTTACEVQWCIAYWEAPGCSGDKFFDNLLGLFVLVLDNTCQQVMAAIRDVQQNGLSAMAKYSQDPEIMAVIDDLKSLF